MEIGGVIGARKFYFRRILQMRSPISRYRDTNTSYSHFKNGNSSPRMSLELLSLELNFRVFYRNENLFTSLGFQKQVLVYTTLVGC
jgi:hypothetical protein